MITQKVKLYEAAWLLQITVNAARRMVKDRTLLNVGSGKLVYIAADDLRSHLRSSRAQFALDDLLTGRVTAPKPDMPSAKPPALSVKEASVRTAA
jgi:hypothetical protein